MQTEIDPRHLTLEQLLETISSSQPTSGAGVAAAVALALAIGCATKAINVSLKHGSDAVLDAAALRLHALSERALAYARTDSALFASYLQTHSQADAAGLVTSAEEFQELAGEVLSEIEELRGRVLPTVAIDVSTALRLHSAATSTEVEILRSNRKLQARAESLDT